MEKIPLTNGKVALVDSSDYAEASKRKWVAYKVGKKWRVARTESCTHNRSGKTTIHLARYIVDCAKGMEVDHINGNPLDNRRGNLRVCSRLQNAKNKGRYSNSSHKFKGIIRIPSGFRARIGVNGVKVHLGVFKTEVEAALAYNEAALIHHGDFARLNRITT